MKAGWEVKQLGEVCELYQPKTITKKEMTDDGAYPVYGANGVIGRYTTFNHEEPQLVIGCRGACGTIHITSPKAWITGNSMVVAPKSCEVDLRFLSYYFQDSDRLEGVITGAAQPQITRTSLSPVLVTIPPLAEQKQIVAVLDAAFEGLTRAKDNAEANLQNARELFELAITSLIDEGSINSDVAGLETFCSFENGDRGKNYPGRKAFVASGVPFINAGHLESGTIDWANMNYIPEEHYNRLSNGKIARNDVLFCLRGSLGKFAIVDRDCLGAIASSLVIVRCRPSLLPEYLALYFNSSFCRDEIEKYEGGAAQPNLSAKSLRAFAISVPNLDAQKALILRFNQLKGMIAIASSDYTTKLTDIADLRQSLLQKAFAGDLT